MTRYSLFTPVLAIVALSLFATSGLTQEPLVLEEPDAAAFAELEALASAAAYETGDRLFAEDQGRDAMAAYLQAMAAFPDAVERDRALFRVGMVLRADGRNDEAKRYWERLLADIPNSQYVLDTQKNLLDLYQEVGQLFGALDILSLWLGKATGAEKPGLLLEIAQVQLKMQEPERALRSLLRRQRILPEDKKEAGAAELKHIIDTRLSQADLEILTERFIDPMPGAWVLERLVRIYAEKENYYLTGRWGRLFLERFSDWESAPEIRDIILAQQQSINAYENRIGVLLPLTGDMGAYGERVRRGVQLAYDLARPSLPKGKVAIWVRDMGMGEPLLGSHYKRLVKNVDPTVVIGPLLSGDVLDNARIARSRQVPMIAPLVPLPEGAEGAAVGLGPTPEMDGVAAARYAVRNRDLSRFIMLAPEGKYGQRVTGAFERELTRLGGAVQETIFYSPQAREMRGRVQNLVLADLQVDGVAEMTEEDVEALGPVEMEIAGLLEEEKPKAPVAPVGEDGLMIATTVVPEAPKEEKPPLFGPPVGPHTYYPGFDGVFLAGSWERVVVVAPHLPFHDINVPIIGTSGWNDLRVIRKGGGAVRGARFVSPLYRLNPDAKKFVTAYRERYGESPGLFASLGHDAMLLALKAVQGEGFDALERMSGALAGATGNMVVSPDGRVARELHVLRISSKGFSEETRISVEEEPELLLEELPEGMVGPDSAPAEEGSDLAPEIGTLEAELEG